MRSYFALSTVIVSVILLLTFSSCKKDDPVIEAPITSNNLVIVTDNDPGSYMMIKIVGKVKTSFPGVQITYLQCKKYDIIEGAFLLNTALKSFPEGSVIAGIIEPGAGGKKIVMQTSSRKVLAPDNTLATWILNESPSTVCYFVENSKVLGNASLYDISFEDFYAYSICSLLSGFACKEFGPLCGAPNTFPAQQPVMTGDTLKGQILFTDNFGNCISNIPDNLMNDIIMGTLLTLKSDTTELKIKKGVTYSSVPTGDNVCFINSSKLLELSVNYGSFSGKYNIKAGSRISITK